MSGWRPALAICSAAAAAGCSGQTSDVTATDASDLDVTAVAPIEASNDGNDAMTAMFATGADASEAAPSCSPTPTGFPVWMPPTGYPKSVCAPSDVATLVHDCLVNHLPMCAQDRANLAGCYQCLVTQIDSAAWGPFVLSPDRLFFNYGGCFAIELGDSSKTGCGAARGLRDDCEWSNCAAACFTVDAGGVDGGNVALYQACEAAAIAGVCASYEDAIHTDCPSSSPAFSPCFGTGLSTEQFQDQLGDIFCAGGPDAGTTADAGGDADAHDEVEVDAAGEGASLIDASDASAD